jgi:uncharacterized protein YjbI with pentapeptide repeats
MHRACGSRREAWRPAERFAWSSAEGVDLSDYRFPGTNFSGSQLYRADFSRADLAGAAFQNARMNGAVLTTACLGSARFTSAMLSGATLVGADLRSLAGRCPPFARLAQGAPAVPGAMTDAPPADATAAPAADPITQTAALVGTPADFTGAAMQLVDFGTLGSWCKRPSS